MTSFRGMDGVSGRPGVGSTGTQLPANPTNYTGNMVTGTVFTVSSGGIYLEGYWHHVSTGMSVTPVKCALWTYASGSQKQVIPGSTVTSGALSLGDNFIPLATPIPLGIGCPYIAAIGVNGAFNSTQSQYGAGDRYSAGITNGPLTVYSGATGSFPAPYGMAQGIFTVAGNDPGVTMPQQEDSGGDQSTNFWTDVQVTNTIPAGSSLRGQPSVYFADYEGGDDDNQPYTIATEFTLSQEHTLDKIWFLSPVGAVSLPTRCSIWNTSSEARVADNTAPAWSGVAGSGYVSCSFTSTNLAAGTYKVSAYNSAGSSGMWGYKRLGFFAAFSTLRVIAPNGITAGTLTIPNVANASSAQDFDTSATEPGQGTFAIGDSYPIKYVNNNGAAAQFYGVDVEVTPTTSGNSGGSGSAVTVTCTIAGTCHYWLTPQPVQSTTGAGVLVGDIVHGWIWETTDDTPTVLSLELDSAYAYDVSMSFRGAPPILFDGFTPANGDMLEQLTAQGWIGL